MRAVWVILARVNARVCVYDEIGKKIYSVVFERRRYALRGEKSTFTTFLDDQKRQISPFQIFCGATSFVGGGSFFSFFSPLSLFSLFPVSVSISLLVCTVRARI